MLIEFVIATNSKLDILNQDYVDIENEVYKMEELHQIEIKNLQEDFMKKLKLLSQTDKDSFICESIFTPEILSIPCFIPYNQLDTDDYFRELRFNKNTKIIKANLADIELDFEDVEYILCTKLATYLFENNFVKNKFNVVDGLVTFNLNVFNLNK